MPAWYGHSSPATRPLLSVDATFPRTTPALYYSGRVYGPQVVLGHDGKTATMVFAGYRTPKPLPKPGTVLGTDPNALYTVGANDLATYRSILTVTLTAR